MKTLIQILRLDRYDPVICYIETKYIQDAILVYASGAIEAKVLGAYWDSL